MSFLPMTEVKAKQPEEVKFPKNKDLIEKISLFRGDITKLEIDAIVNTGKSNTMLGLTRLCFHLLISCIHFCNFLTIFTFLFVTFEYFFYFNFLRGFL